MNTVVLGNKVIALHTREMVLQQLERRALFLYIMLNFFNYKNQD